MNEKYGLRQVLRDNGWIAAVCAPVGVFLYSLGFKSGGVVLVVIAMLFVAVGILALVASPFATVSRKMGIFLRATVGVVPLVFRHIVGWLKAVYGRLLKFFLAPALAELRTSISSLQRETSTLGQRVTDLPSNWVADGVGQDDTCYQSYKDEGGPIRSISFRLKPDYQFPNWRAGFALTESSQENPFWKGIRFHIELDGVGHQPKVKLMSEGSSRGDSILTVFSYPKPVYSIDAALWQENSGVDYQIIIWVDGEAKIGPLKFRKPIPKVFSLVAWSDSGKRFQVSFEDVSLCFARRWREQ
jgi:hypothetical protein